jgi:hypothetical protein
LVVTAGVEDQVAKELPAAGEHADVQVVHEDEDGSAGVASAESDVVQLPDLAVGCAAHVVGFPAAAVSERPGGGATRVDVTPSC